MLYAAIFIFFLAIFLLLYGVLSALTRNKAKIEGRLSELKQFDEVDKDTDENKTFSERVIKPFNQNFGEALLKATPKHKLDVLNKRLDRAGLLKNGTVGKWLFQKTVVIIVFSAITGILSLALSHSILAALILTVLVLLMLNYFFSFYISRKIELRKNKILKDLPYTLDLITVSVEAGLSFDGAMARVVGNISGEICDEFSKSLKEIKMGIERKAALKKMSDRCDVKELSMLVTAIIQADELGVSLSNVLRIQSANLRELRRQTAREKAMKAPIKMLFPLIIFIFPAIFVIILGPAVINIINIFGGK